MAASLPSTDFSKKQEISIITKSLEQSSLEEPSTCEIIDTCAALSKLLDGMVDLPTTPPSIYIDLEGVYLSRHGTISILQLFIAPHHRTYLIDIYTLQEKAFSTPGTKGQTLKDILESKDMPKVFFDVRNDSDALYAHFKVNLACIHDIQLMELATRSFSRRLVKGLAKCIENEARMTAKEKLAWKDAKEKGMTLFDPNRGGSYEVFNERPLSEEIKTYCVQDTQFLPRLWTCYNQKMTSMWAKKVEAAIKERVFQSQQENYNGCGPHKALAPQGWV